MGTVADKLNAVLTSKNAIKTKCGLADDLPFSQYANYLEAADAPEYIKCIATQSSYFRMKNVVHRIWGYYTGNPNNGEEPRVWGKEDDNVFMYIAPDTDTEYAGRIIARGPEGVYYVSKEKANVPWEVTEWEYGPLVTDSAGGSPVAEHIPDVVTAIGYHPIIYDAATRGFSVNTDVTGWRSWWMDSTIEPVVGGIYDFYPQRVSVAQLHPNLTGAVSGDGGSGEFYLCSYVNRNYFSYNTIVVSGMPTDAFVGSVYIDDDTWEEGTVPTDIAARDPNGTYTWQNPDDESYNWYWLNENGCVIDHWNMAMGQLAIYPDVNYKGTNNKFIYLPTNDMGEVDRYPAPEDYTSFEWTYSNAGTDTVVEGGTVAIPEPEAVEQYWEGYKLVQNENGKYDFATETTRLTYADYMPVAGRIYDGACTMEITNANLSDDALWSCPHGMTANESDEWVITSTAVYGENYAWKAFDSDDSTSVWCINNSSDGTVPWYIQWENTARSVLVQRLVIYCNDNYLGDNSFFQGSNDGTTWVDIFTGNMVNNHSSYEDGKYKVTWDFSHGTPYKYHRLGRNFNSGSYIIISKIEAYSQIPREVPK